MLAPRASVTEDKTTNHAAPSSCRPDRLLAYKARFGLSNRLLELQTALRVAVLTNRTLLLPSLLPGISWSDAFNLKGLTSKHCVVPEGSNGLPNVRNALALKLPKEHTSMRSYFGLPVTTRTLAGIGEDGIDTRGVATHVARAFADTPVVILLSTLHVKREPSAAACESERIRPHCMRPGVSFWAPPPPFLRRFWRSLVLPSAVVSQRARQITRALRSPIGTAGVQERFMGIHMRNADGSCPTRVQMWYGGMQLQPEIPRCGKIPGCTSLDTSCCDFTLVPQPGGNRFSAALLHEVRGYCEEDLADANLASRLASERGLARVYVGADGQRPDLEQRLVVSLAASGFVPLHTLNASQRPRSRVWSSKNARRGWRLSDVEDALVDMYVLAEAEAFVANPASSFSGCVRDIRAARGRSLASTQVGVPPHDARAWTADLERKATRRKQRTAH